VHFVLFLTPCVQMKTLWKTPNTCAGHNSPVCFLPSMCLRAGGLCVHQASTCQVLCLCIFFFTTRFCKQVASNTTDVMFLALFVFCPSLCLHAGSLCVHQASTCQLLCLCILFYFSTPGLVFACKQVASSTTDVMFLALFVFCPSLCLHAGSLCVHQTSTCQVLCLCIVFFNTRFGVPLQASGIHHN